MPHRHIVELPPLRGLSAHAARQLAETTFAPTALFWALLHLTGLRTAIIGALAFSYLLVGRRLVTRRPVPMLLVLGALLLTARSVLALATHSAFLYFLQPAVNAFLVAALFSGSVLVGRPVIRKLTRDFIDLPAMLQASSGLQAFFRRVTLLWALVNVLNGAVALRVLLANNLDTVLLVRSAVSPMLTATAIGISVVWGRRVLHGEGIALRLRWQAPTGPRPAVLAG